MLNYDNIHNQLIRKNILDMYIIEKGGEGSGVKGHNLFYQDKPLYGQILSYVSNQGIKSGNEEHFIRNMKIEIKRRSFGKYTWENIHKINRDKLLDLYRESKHKGRYNN